MDATLQPNQASERALPGRLLPRAGRALTGRLTVPGDKSMSHRALICAALAEGDSLLGQLAEAADVRATRQALGALGVAMEPHASGGVLVRGRGLHWQPPKAPIDCGNSGTSVRLLAGALVATRTPALLIGDASLTSRPMRHLVDLLAAMGGELKAKGERHRLPLAFGKPSAKPVARAQVLPVPSAQLASAAILAALGATGTLELRGAAGMRDHTERLLRTMGAICTRRAGAGGTIAMPAGQRLQPLNWQVPGDPSSAAFWLAAAAIVPGSELAIEQVSLNETRLGFCRLLARMGALVHWQPMGGSDFEPYGTIIVRARALRGVVIDEPEARELIDELPLVAAIASFATGQTIVGGAAQLRTKECDRIDAMVSALTTLGARCQARPDGFVIDGPTRLGGGQLDSRGDHRVAMALAVAALGAAQPVELTGWQATDTSYPTFWSAWTDHFG